ncbi:MAG: DNA internalization-related competence protein ComEC/Rec2 [Betaproteobacteria bacterium]|nr:DNA internalization-related competence protein ComEC/Rec2 [Betaproteobacteria bacterium]
MRIAILGFLAGIFWLQQQAALPPIWWWTLPLMAFAVLWLFRQTSGAVVHLLRFLVIVTSFAALGVAWATWRADIRLAQELPREWEGRDVELVGVVASLPRAAERGTRFEFDIEQVATAGAVIPRRVSLSWYAETNRKTEEITPPPLVVPGERWRFTVRLRRPHGTQNPHGFDFEAWALERNIRATGYIRPKGVNQREAAQVRGFMYRIDRMRMSIRDQMLEALKDQPYRGVLVALAIGEQSAIPPEQWKVFWRTGTGHLMSISGLHITMVASLIYWLAFRFWARVPSLALRLPAQRAAALAGALAALSYALIAGFSVPTQRTFFMLAAIAMALWFGRGMTGSRILSWALLAVLLLDPWAVLAPGFWLSFGAVAMIFYVTAKRTGKPGAVSGAVKTQIAVTLGLLPMTLALFQEVSLISPIANAFAIPVVSLIVVPITLFGALLGEFMPADLILQLAHLAMQGCYAALAWLAELPGAVWQSHAPPLWVAGLALIGVVWLLAPRGVPMRTAGVVMMLPLFIVVPAGPKQGEVWLHLLDVGQGLAAVVRTAQHSLVYDSGPKWNPDADSGNRIVVPFLRGEGIRSLDTLVITHADEDHSGGAKSVIDARQPKWVMTSMDAESESLRGASEIMKCEVGDAWRWDDVVFEILHPAAETFDLPNVKTNNIGCTLKITAPGGSILLTADIEKLAEQQLLARYRDAPDELKADVMLVPHHGSRTSSTPELLDAVAPKLALVSVGYRSRFRHPNTQVMERYAERNIPTLRTDFLGAITVKIAPGEVPTAIGFRESTRRYWLDPPLRDGVAAEP